MAEDVGHEGVERRRRLLGGQGDDQCTGSDGALPGPALLVGQGAPVLGPFPGDRPGVAGRRGGGQRLTGFADQVGHGLVEPVDPGDEGGDVGGFGVEPQGGERCPQPVGQVGHPFPFGGQEDLDPVGEEVEGVRGIGDLRRAARAGPHVELAVAEPAGDGRQAAGRAGDAAAEGVGDQHGAGHQPERTPRCSSASGTRARTTATSPVPVRTGWKRTVSVLLRALKASRCWRARSYWA